MLQSSRRLQARGSQLLKSRVVLHSTAGWVWRGCLHRQHAACSRSRLAAQETGCRVMSDVASSRAADLTGNMQQPRVRTGHLCMVLACSQLHTAHVNNGREKASSVSQSSGHGAAGSDQHESTGCGVQVRAAALKLSHPQVHLVYYRARPCFRTCCNS